MHNKQTQEFKKNCPACGDLQSHKLESVDLAFQHAYYAPNDPLKQKELTSEAGVDGYQMVRCARCALEYIHPLAAPSVKWYSIAYSLLALYPSDRWEFDYVLDRVNPDSFLMEFACGSGFFLGKCADRGIKAHGLDFEPDAIEQCHKKGLSASLLDVTKAASIPEGIEKIPSVAVAFHILEHLAQPSQLFATANAVTGEDAELWISVPSNLRATRLLRKKDFLDQPPHHITRWSPEALRIMGESQGWELIDMIYEPLSFSSTLWQYSRRFKWAHNFGKRFEQASRVLTYPLSAIKAVAAKDKMSGHTMLAHYKKLIQ